MWFSNALIRSPSYTPSIKTRDYKKKWWELHQRRPKQWERRVEGTPGGDAVVGHQPEVQQHVAAFGQLYYKLLLCNPAMLETNEVHGRGRLFTLW